MAWAASMSPGSTSRSDTSAMRAKNGVPLIDSGTTAAQTPIVVPVTSLVKGSSATRRMMKGVARNPLMTAASKRLKRVASMRPPGEDRTRSKASGTPARAAMDAEMPTMATVSRRACSRRSIINGDIAEHFHVYRHG